MGKLVLVIGLVLVSSGFTQTATAGVMLEPYVGYASGKMGDKSTGQDDGKGMYYGARAAYNMMGLFIGGEYQGAKISLEGNPKKDSSVTDLGAVVGYEFPILLRFYGTYFFSSEAKVTFSPEITFKGNAMKLGVGYTAFPLVAFNVEYYQSTYNKASNGSQSITLTGEDIVKSSLVMLNVSFPFTF